MPKSSSAKDFWYTLFGNHTSEQLEHDLETYDEQSIAERHDGKQLKRPSLYVKVFEDMVNVIIENEKHLLSDEELDVLRVYNGLEYCARYLLVRLVFRQPEWHALSSLQKYISEIGEKGLQEALNALCAPLRDTKPSQPSMPLTPSAEKRNRSGVIDLTFSDDEAPLPSSIDPSQLPPKFHIKPSTKASQVVEEPAVDPHNLEFDYLFRDQSSMSVEEALNRLTVPDLREIMKLMKVGSPLMRKEAIIRAMMRHAAGQHTLPSLAKKKAKSKKPSKWDGMVQTQLSFGQKPKDVSQLKRLREMALERLGPCVKINPNLYWLIGRLHIICYRGTEKPTKYCLPALLAGFKKWNFPEYQYERDASIWPTREDLLEFEEALHLDAEMDVPPEVVSAATGVAAPSGVSATPLKTLETSSRSETEFNPKEEEKVEDLLLLPVDDQVVEVSDEVKESSSMRKAKHIKKLYSERIKEKWKTLVCRKRLEKGKAPERTPGLERFEAGHVYTRMVGKAASAFGMLREYETELAILEELLQQTYWRQGKRASWYERRALIQERYIKPLDFEVVKGGILQALADEYTGIVSRPSLVRRLQRLEKKIKLHPEKRTICEAILKNPEEITIKAKRTDLRPGTKLNLGVHLVAGKENNPLLLSDFFTSKTPGKEPLKEDGSVDGNTIVVKLTAPEAIVKRTGKSSWVGFSDEAVNVETYALQYYEMIGYVGFHSETRILTTLFALIFWDIIFSRVRGAFETPFQAGPLDMFEDSFYLARQQLFQTRLREIKEGKAREYLKRHDERYRPKQTWCIGLRWDVCQQKQLLEIIECLGAETLAMLCQLFCEDYAGRTSGVPDLIIWRAEEGICKFVEVKGPGDNPQPNQRLWFDSLLRAGANVEICRVVDQDAPERKKRKGRTPTSKRKHRKEAEEDSDHEKAEEVQQESASDADYLPPSSNAKRHRVELDHPGELPSTPISTVSTSLTI